MKMDLNATVPLPSNSIRINHLHLSSPAWNVFTVCAFLRKFIYWETLSALTVRIQAHELCGVSPQVRCHLYWIFQKFINIWPCFWHCFCLSRNIWSSHFFFFKYLSYHLKRVWKRKGLIVLTGHCKAMHSSLSLKCNRKVLLNNCLIVNMNIL